MQHIFPIIFVLDPDGMGSIGHLTSEYYILLIECAHVIYPYGQAYDRGSMVHNGYVKPTMALLSAPK